MEPMNVAEVIEQFAKNPYPFFALWLMALITYLVGAVVRRLERR
jgi:hypothetical protein